MYRSGDYNKKQRKKSVKKKNWWNTEKSKIQYKNVLFVTPTPGGVLMKWLQERETELNKNHSERINISSVKRIHSKNQNVFKKLAPYVQTVNVVRLTQVK